MMPMRKADVPIPQEPKPMNTTRDYDQDFFGWLNANAELIRERRFDQIDADHVAEELEAMAKSERRELMNRLALLLAHLLQWQYQPPRRTRSWRNTIATQRMDIADLLADSPSLRPLMEERLQAAYEKARLKAEDETGIDRHSFPEQCPYGIGQVLDSDFLPSAVTEDGAA